MNFKELRKNSGMTLSEFSIYFEIKYRTVATWEQGTRKCPEHLLKLMEYKLKKEGIIDNEKNN